VLPWCSPLQFKKKPEHFARGFPRPHVGFDQAACFRFLRQPSRPSAPNRSLTALHPLRSRLYQPETPIVLRGRRFGQGVQAREIARNDYRTSSVQVETNEAIAELRELYRLVRMFAFYQYKARDTLGDQLTNQLKGWCVSQDLPDAGVDWRMQKPDFERFLRQIAEARGCFGR